MPLASGDGGWVYEVFADALGDVFALSQGNQVWRLEDAGFVLDAELVNEAGRPYDLWGLGGSSSDLWATAANQSSGAGHVGSLGAILHRTDGGWAEVVGFPDGTLGPHQVLGLTTLSPTDVWFYGHHLHHWDGAGMTEVGREDGASLISSAVALDGGVYLIGSFCGVRVLRSPN